MDAKDGGVGLLERARYSPQLVRVWNAGARFAGVVNLNEVEIGIVNVVGRIGGGDVETL